MWVNKLLKVFGLQLRKFTPERKPYKKKRKKHTFHYYTLERYVHLKGLDIPVGGLISLGHKCSAASKELGLEVKKIKSVKYGAVNSYRSDVLRKVFKELKGE